MLSHFSLFWLFAVLWTVSHQAPLSMGFSRQEYWSGLPCPPPGDLPNPGLKPTSLMSPALAGGFFIARATWHICNPYKRKYLRDVPREKVPYFLVYMDYKESFIYFKEVILVLFSFYVFLYKVLHFHFIFIFVFMILLFILKVFPCNSKVIKPFDLFNLLEQLENLLMIHLNPCILTLWQSKKGKEKLGV